MAIYCNISSVYFMGYAFYREEMGVEQIFMWNEINEIMKIICQNNV